jgi:glucose-fructose oxidoreductase
LTESSGSQFCFAKGLFAGQNFKPLHLALAAVGLQHGRVENTLAARQMSRPVPSPSINGIIVAALLGHDGHQGPKEIGVQPEFLEWLTDPAENGAGALYDFGCYGADLMTWLMHGEAPLSVTAVAQTDKPQTYPHVDDDATIILRYPRAQAVLMPSWDWTFGRKDMEVYGTTGYAIAVNPNQIRERIAESSPEVPLTLPPLSPPQDTSLHYLAAVVRGELEPQADLTALDTNIIVMQILDAARQSARTGKTVLLHPLP